MSVLLFWCYYNITYFTSGDKKSIKCKYLTHNYLTYCNNDTDSDVFSLCSFLSSELITVTFVLISGFQPAKRKYLKYEMFDSFYLLCIVIFGCYLTT